MADLQSFTEREPSFSLQNDANNLVAFNLTDFPYVPDPTQPQLVEDKPNLTQLECPAITKNSNTAENELPLVKYLAMAQSVRTYRVTSVLCMLAAVGALSDGYQVQMSGSIVALPRFIRTFGDLQSSGKYKNNPQYLSLWGCK
ncbi:hypothetical protein QQZ08_005409 [Neonectria magnoliae]|uniref:Uncharacterized protein n=1 Tax=Neonectria magnoliae TaxID=2732573 RepID=A0ABR1I362_9HYPO